MPDPTLRIPSREFQIPPKREKALSQNPRTIRVRRKWERMVALVSARVCVICKYAFISRKGHNLCSPCMRQIKNDYCDLHFRPHDSRPHQGLVTAWAFKTGRIPYTPFCTIHPHYLIPDLNSPRVQSALNATFERMQQTIATGYWIEDVMPRLSPPLLYYPNVRRAHWDRRLKPDTPQRAAWREQWRKRQS